MRSPRERYKGTVGVPILMLQTKPKSNYPELKKRDGRTQTYASSKIRQYLTNLMSEPPRLGNITVNKIADRLQSTMSPSMSTAQLAAYISEVCAALAVEHWQYGALGGRVCVSMLHRTTPATFSDAVRKLGDVLDTNFVKHVMDHETQLNAMVDHGRDFQYDIMGFKTLERSYLLKKNGVIVERPQYMLMRVAVALHGSDLEAVHETYEATSRMLYTHATPTLFHAGMASGQLASCYLMTMTEDSIEGIFETLKRCALISKGAGGIGLSVSNVRGKYSEIKGTNGTSNGLTPMLRVFNDTARYVDQGGGRRKGSFAVFLEPHHPDILDFLELKKNHGVESEKARDLFYGLWISDLFMKRVKSNGPWSVICPTKCRELQDAYGDEYERLYLECEKQGNVTKTFDSARDIWFAILDAQIETGTPYMMYKDACNRKSNQQNLGTIRGSNLCCEIVEYTSPEEAAVCTLASIALPRCVERRAFDFDRLETVVRLATRNLNKTIDLNRYPLPQARRSNMRHRPIGIGVQGLADVFQALGHSYDSQQARELNKHIFETIYYAALDESCRLAQRDGSYETFAGSPLSRGDTQIQLWGVDHDDTRHPWTALRERIRVHGTRNSLLTAPMPTASTASILGNTESFEPRTSNLYTRRVLAGEYIVINRYLQEALLQRGIWSDALAKKLIEHRGSVQSIDEVPDDIKAVFRTVWEISQRSVIDMAADRGIYIDQSQSLNLHVEEPTRALLTSIHFYGWQKGLKTGQYYLRMQPKARAMQFTVAVKKQKTEDDDEGCLMCSA